MNQFLHMHHAMANKALMMETCERLQGCHWSTDKARLREIVLSGKADYRSRWENIAVTDADRQIVLRYLDV